MDHRFWCFDGGLFPLGFCQDPFRLEAQYMLCNTKPGDRLPKRKTGMSSSLLSCVTKVDFIAHLFSVCSIR